nr:hypothetical protein [Candidatus Mycoplasma haematolamae]
MFWTKFATACLTVGGTSAAGAYYLPELLNSVPHNCEKCPKQESWQAGLDIF